MEAVQLDSGARGTARYLGERLNQLLADATLTIGEIADALGPSSAGEKTGLRKTLAISSVSRHDDYKELREYLRVQGCCGTPSCCTACSSVCRLGEAAKTFRALGEPSVDMEQLRVAHASLRSVIAELDRVVARLDRDGVLRVEQVDGLRKYLQRTATSISGIEQPLLFLLSAY